MTDLQTFRDTLTGPTPPANTAPALEALWYAQKGDWDRAHGIVQGHEGDPVCDLVHAHLHRQEGDADNARSWYAASGEPFPELPLDQEWNAIVTKLLARGPA